MIQVTKLNGQVFYLNPHQIESIELTPDTTITMLSGKRLVVKDDYDVIHLHTDNTFAQIENQLKILLDKFGNNQILIMTDLYGGTPFNIASKFYRKNDNICLISGMNLDMVIEYFSSDLHHNISKFIDEIISVSKDSIALYTKNESEIYADIDI